MTGENKRVAIIGAGAAGIICCKRFIDDGYNVTVFEQTEQVGGTWVYREEVGENVHSSMYKNLKTNLARQSMGFLNFPFPQEYPTFMHHSHVLQYLQSFAESQNLLPSINFNAKVLQILPEDSENPLSGGWNLTWESLLDGSVKAEKFDFISICNGHYAFPHIPEIKGIANFKGKIIHSHDYRENVPFTNQSVVIVGSAFSGMDIANEIKEVAKKVHICQRKNYQMNTPGSRVVYHNNLVLIDNRGYLTIENEEEKLDEIDSIIFCTGYEYKYPFIDSTKVPIFFKYKRVCNLYLHMLPFNRFHPEFSSEFPIQHPPTIAFIGLPWRVVPFPLFDYQVQFIAKLWKKECQLPTPEKIKQSKLDEKQRLKENNLAAHYRHMVGDMQFQYCSLLKSMAPSIIEADLTKASKITEATSIIRQEDPDYKSRELVEEDGTYKFVPKSDRCEIN